VDWDPLISYWRSKCVPYRPGVSETELHQFALRYQVVLPDEFRSLYLTTDGTFVSGAPGCDDRGFAFWSLDEVRPDADYEWAFVFADFREESWWYAIALGHCSEAVLGAIYIFGDIGRKPRLVAESLSGFVDLYLRDDCRLYIPRAL